MGRVLPAHLPAAEPADHLARAHLVPLTSRTVTDAAKLEAVPGRVKARGFALVDQELEGLRSAAPVRNREGVVVAAVNLSVSAGRTSLRRLEDEFVPPLVETAGQISGDLARSAS